MTDPDEYIRTALEDLNLHCTDHAPDPDCDGCRSQLRGMHLLPCVHCKAPTRDIGNDVPMCNDCQDQLAAAPVTDREVDVQLLAWAVTNCHMLARRALAHTASVYDREKWEHVQRICEKAGARSSGVLRASLPTEITEGSTAPVVRSGADDGSAR